MKLVQFKYKKKNVEEIKTYDLLTLYENDNHIAGISLGNLTPEEIEALKKLQKEYEENLKPYMKAYRSFIKEGIIEE